METLDSYKIIKKHADPYIENRHLYVANIIKELFNPMQHKYLCEIGAGDFELASILASSYENIDAYEMYPGYTLKNKFSNINIYQKFGINTNVSNYHLLLSVCPYIYAYDICDDDIDTEWETQKLVTDILKLSIRNSIDSFIILSNTYSSIKVLEEIKDNDKYKNVEYDDISLHCEEQGKTRISNNKVLIYKAH
jgi:16S rRNA A1518/A1519 N6-dimethyltransferase RsmA/KsgA/DIM1 with predicted DNA glycosylase/AP lyase activity